MAILTNSNKVQLTTNNGKSLITQLGSVVQFVSSTSTAQNTTQRVPDGYNDFVDTTLQVTLTPKRVENRIIIRSNFFAWTEWPSANGNNAGNFQCAPSRYRIIKRISGNADSAITDTAYGGMQAMDYFGLNNSVAHIVSLVCVDTIASLNQTTYVLQQNIERSFAGFSDPTVAHKSDKPARISVIRGSGNLAKTATISAMEYIYIPIGVT